MRVSSTFLLPAWIASVIAGSASVCPKNNMHASGMDLQRVLEYKETDHQLMAAYIRSWRDVASGPDNKASMDNLPDCLDIAFVFWEGDEPDLFYKTLKEKYVPILRSRGTKVVRTIGTSQILNDTFASNPEGYEALANYLVATYVDAHGLDGLDVDVESSLTSEELTKATGVFEALSKHLGPKSGTGMLLTYDTNQDGTSPLFRAVHSYISYLLVQSYGRSVSTLQRTFDTYKRYIKSSQYLVGFSFYEERGNRWGDVIPPINTSHAYQFANWQPRGAQKGGLFAYAIDRDGVVQGSDALVATNYTWTQELISTMNP